MAIKLVLAGIAAAVAVVGGVMAQQSYNRAARTEEQVGAHNQKLAERDADIKEQNAREELQLSKLKIQDEQRQFDDIQSSTQLALNHNGWMLDGTPALQLAYNADQFEEQSARNERAGRVNERGLMDKAVQDRMRGQLELTMGYQRSAALRAQGTSALMGGFSGAAGSLLSVRRG